MLNLCLFISVNYHLLENTIFVVDQIGRTNFTIPYIDGSLSISRASRTYPAFLIFKPGMIITAILLYFYWYKNNLLINYLSENSNKNSGYLKTQIKNTGRFVAGCDPFEVIERNLIALL